MPSVDVDWSSKPSTSRSRKDSSSGIWSKLKGGFGVGHTEAPAGSSHRSSSSSKSKPPTTQPRYASPQAMPATSGAAVRRASTSARHAPQRPASAAPDSTSHRARINSTSASVRPSTTYVYNPKRPNEYYATPSAGGYDYNTRSIVANGPFITIRSGGAEYRIPATTQGPVGNTYIIQDNGGPALVRPNNASAQNTHGSRTASTTHHSSASHSTRPRTMSTATPGSFAATAPRPPLSSNSSYTSTVRGGEARMMYDGRLLVGDPKDLQHYVTSQNGVRNWLAGIRPPESTR